MRWTIQNKILANFGVVILMLVVLVIMNWELGSSNIRGIEQARDKGYAGVKLATDIRYDVNQVWQWLTDISATRATEGFDDGFDEAEAYAEKFHANVAQLAELHPDERQRLEELSDSFEAFYSKGQWMAQQYIEGGPQQGNPAMLEFDAFAADIVERVEALEAELNTEAEMFLQEAIDNNHQSRYLAVITSVVAIVVAIILAILLARSITNAVNTMSRAAARIAGGDLEHQIQVQSNDELGEMAASFRRMIGYLQCMAANADRLAQGDLTADLQPQSEKDVLGHAFLRMVESLRGLVGEVANDAKSLSEASSQLSNVAGQASQATNQISITMQQLAAGVQQQSKSTLHTKSTIEQVTRAIDGVAHGAQEQAEAIARSADMANQIGSAIHQVAANAQAGAEGASNAAQTARRGANIVGDTIQGMQAIKTKVGLSAQKVREMGQRSQQIGAIVETIDEIASQTNLLALNAAIEAARAGENGKGFAVVADEVRKLAEKSTDATDEITQLVKVIQQSVTEAVAAMEEGASEVESGVQRANDAGDALADILKAIEAVGIQVKEISAAAQNMNVSSDKLVNSMERVSAVVEENSATAEEMAANSSEVFQAIDNVACVSESNSAAVEEVGAASEEMSAQVHEVSDAAQVLNAMAQSLQGVVAQFKLNTTKDDTVALNGYNSAQTKIVSTEVLMPNGNGYHSP
ncbi:MAG: HAMP domain-containing protein [Anaerolineae bacterium]|nr:HAMP domain-containing protein [Anaerolineae bacterium]